MKINMGISDYIIMTVVTGLWLNLSGLVRFLPYVVPEAREFLAGVPNIAAINAKSLWVWALWGTVQPFLYVFVFRLCVEVYGNSTRAIIRTAFATWGFCFFLLWVALANMGYSSWRLAFVVLPITLVEAFFAAIIMSKIFNWSTRPREFASKTF